MEAQQQNYYPHHHYLQQQETAAAHEETGNNNNNNNNKSPSFVCRQSSTRWTPTIDQIRILKELYHNDGIRSPSAEQIQRISARLRQYGKIEGKNVFYWFQNHKARERQKKKFITTTSTHDHLNHITSSFHTNTSNAAANWRSSQVVDHSILYNDNISSTPPSGVVPCPSSSPAGVLSAVGHIGSYAYGYEAIEKSFRECSISPKDISAGSLSQNPHFNSVPCLYPFLGHIKSIDDDDESLEEEEDDDDESPELETLPLFPIRGEDSSGYYTTTTTTNTTSTTSTSGWYRSNVDESSFGGSARASLELTLNSYITGSSRSSHFY